MVLIVSHGYSSQAVTHAISLNVVIYTLLLGGQHRKMPATQSRILKEKLFLRYHKKSTIIDKPEYIFWNRNRPNEQSIGRSLLTRFPNTRLLLYQKVSKVSHCLHKKLISSAYSIFYCNCANIQVQLVIIK